MFFENKTLYISKLTKIFYILSNLKFLIFLSFPFFFSFSTYSFSLPFGRFAEPIVAESVAGILALPGR